MRMRAVPQYVRAEAREDDGMSWGDPPTVVDVFVGEAVVFTHTAEPYAEAEQAEFDAVTEFGKLLAEMVAQQRGATDEAGR